MALIDNIAKKVSPNWYLNRLAARRKIEVLETAYKGASKRRPFESYNPSTGTANDDTISELPDLRSRSRDLERNNAVAKGAIEALTGSVVNTGLRLQARIDYKRLGMTEEAAKDWERDVEGRFNTWAESLDVDITRRNNFYQMQELAFRSMLVSGDAFVLPVKRHSKLALQLVEADRVDSSTFSRLNSSTERLAGGVETNAFGQPTFYHFTKPDGMDTQRVRAFLKLGNWSLPNVYHLMKQDRPNQFRGVPFLSTVISVLKNLDRYIDAELIASIVAGKFTAFIVTPDGASEDERGSLPDLDYGATVELAEGEDIRTANPGRPNAAFDAFVNSLIRQVAMALQIPYEILQKQFMASYSASRASRVEFQKTVQIFRSTLAVKFCQSAYSRFMLELILSGAISAPGFLEDEEIRDAYLRAEWVGPSLGLLDPVKETQAAKLKVDNLLSTRQREIAELNGGDWDRMQSQLAKEKKQVAELGGLDPQIDGEQDKDQSENKEDDDADQQHHKQAA